MSLTNFCRRCVLIVFVVEERFEHSLISIRSTQRTAGEQCRTVRTPISQSVVFLTGDINNDPRRSIDHQLKKRNDGSTSAGDGRISS